MKVVYEKKNGISFLLAYGIILALLGLATWLCMDVFQIEFMDMFFGGFALILLVILAYYWMNSKNYWGNLGRTRRTFYVVFLLLMAVGFIMDKLDYTDWALMAQLSALAVFVDLAVFQTPNILKIWSAEFKHEDEIREALVESKYTIVRNAKKVEKFTEVIKWTDFHLAALPIPTTQEEYQVQLEEYIKYYSSTFGFAVSFFLFPALAQDESPSKGSLQLQLRNVSIRHARQIAGEEKEQLIAKLTDGETTPIQEDKLIVIPYYGAFYSMLVTLEAKDVAVDAIDASHISNMLVIFDWYMADAESVDADDDAI